MEIDKDIVLECLDKLPDDYKDAMAHAMILLAYIVDMSDRIEENTPMSITLAARSEDLKRNYIIKIDEEVEK